MAEIPLPTGWSSFVTGCASCPEDTVPVAGQQSLAVVHCYDITGGVPDGTLSSNNAGQMNFVTGTADTESFIALVTNQSGFEADYPLTTSYQVIEATGENLAGVTSLSIEGGIGRTGSFTGQSSGTGRQGHADGRGVLHSLTNLLPSFMSNGTVMVYFDYDTNTVTYFLFSAGTHSGTWAKWGNRLWHTRTAPVGLDRYDVSTGGAAITNGNFTAICTDVTFIRSLNPTNAFLYAFIRGGGTSIGYRLDLDTMAVVATYPGMPATLLSAHMVNDDLGYLWNLDSAGVWGFYTFIPSAGTATLIDQVVASCSPTTQDQSGQLGLHYSNGYFYITSGAFGSGSPNITKIGTLVCPELGIPFGSST